MNRKRPFKMVAAALLGAALTAALPGATVPTAVAADDAANPVAAQFFRVEWSVGSGHPGKSRITGYVYND